MSHLKFMMDEAGHSLYFALSLACANLFLLKHNDRTNFVVPSVMILRVGGSVEFHCSVQDEVCLR